MFLLLFSKNAKLTRAWSAYCNVGELELLDFVGPKTVRPPNALDRTDADARSLCHPSPSGAKWRNHQAGKYGCLSQARNKYETGLPQLRLI
jgi:hypothetical protein